MAFYIIQCVQIVELFLENGRILDRFQRSGSLEDQKAEKYSRGKRSQENK